MKTYQDQMDKLQTLNTIFGKYILTMILLSLLIIYPLFWVNYLSFWYTLPTPILVILNSAIVLHISRKVKKLHHYL